MSAEPQDAEQIPSDAVRSSKNGRYLLILLGAVVLVVVVVAVAVVQKGRGDQRAAQQLKAMGALPITQGGRTDSLAVALPEARDKLDEIMPLVPKLGYLKTFNASTADLADRHMIYIGSVKTLVNLLLSETQITDEGVKELAGLSNLESLYLADTDITSVSVPVLAQLRSLKVLDIGGTRISGGLEPLRQLDQLEVLTVNDLKLSDADVEALGQIPKLKLLYVKGTEISKQGLQELRKNVKQLNFGG